MDPTRLNTALRVWTVGAIVVGGFLTFFGSATMTAVGVVLLILGLMSLLPVLRFAWLELSQA